MKKKRILFILGVAMLAACSDENAVQAPEQKAPVALCVQSASASAEVTRAALESGSIGVFQLKNAEGYTPKANLEYTYSGGAWQSAGDDILLNNKNAEICAYAPYNAAVTNVAAVPVLSGKYVEGKGLIYAKTLTGDVNWTSYQVNFQMQQACSRITFRILRDASYTGVGAVSGITIQGAGIYTSAKLNVATGVYSDLISGSLSFNPGISSCSTTEASITGAVLVPAETFTGGLTFTFVVDGTSLKATSSAFSLLQAGTNYVATVTIKAAPLSLPAINIGQWTDVPYDQEIETVVPLTGI